MLALIKKKQRRVVCLSLHVPLQDIIFWARIEPGSYSRLHSFTISLRLAIMNLIKLSLCFGTLTNGL